MAPLRAEHRDLLPHIEKLRAAAEAVGTAPPERTVALVDDCVLFLTRHLIPHAKAEEAALYPVVQKVMGAPQATATMSRDHEEVGRLAPAQPGYVPGLAGLNVVRPRAARCGRCTLTPAAAGR